MGACARTADKVGRKLTMAADVHLCSVLSLYHLALQDDKQNQRAHQGQAPAWGPLVAVAGCGVLLYKLIAGQAGPTAEGIERKNRLLLGLFGYACRKECSCAGVLQRSAFLLCCRSVMRPLRLAPALCTS